MNKVFISALLALFTLAMPLYSPAADAPRKVRIGYNGSACEAALFVAVHKGYFKEAGVDADLVKRVPRASGPAPAKEPPGFPRLEDEDTRDPPFRQGDLC